MPFAVRAADAADAGQIAVLAGVLGYPPDVALVGATLRELLRRDDHLVLVAESPGQGVCGWLHAHACHVLESGFRVEIAGLVVWDGMRRAGVGRALVAGAEAWARGTGAANVVVRSNAKRAESHVFYPSLGYEAYKTQVVYRKRTGD
jgi:GNAT superfamily N-acetyltransferase